MGSGPECQRPANAQDRPPACRPWRESRRRYVVQSPATPLPRAREEPLSLRPPGAGAPMMRRVVVIALAAAAVFAAILGAVSTAQDPAATSSPEGTPAAIAPAPVESAAPEATTPPVETPAETPQAPVETATQAPTAE